MIKNTICSASCCRSGTSLFLLSEIFIGNGAILPRLRSSDVAKVVGGNSETEVLGASFWSSVTDEETVTSYVVPTQSPA